MLEEGEVVEQTLGPSPQDKKAYFSLFLESKQDKIADFQDEPQSHDKHQTINNSQG